MPVTVVCASALVAAGILGAGSASGNQRGAQTRFAVTAVQSLDPVPRDSASGASSAYTAPPPPLTYKPLSNERTSTYWAYVNSREPIYVHPRSSSRRRALLRDYTEDGFPEVYLLLRQYADARGQVWVELRVPMRPNGTMGWVRRSALAQFTLTHWKIVVDRRGLRMRVYWDGKPRWAGPVGIGKRSTPTPPGNFWIRERFKIRDRNSPYWPYALGTADYSTLTDWPGGGIVGIHGDWHEPQLIPGRPSHGCMRLHDADAAWLATHVSLGTPLLIR